MIHEITAIEPTTGWTVAWPPLDGLYGSAMREALRRFFNSGQQD